MRFEELDRVNQSEALSLILAGLADHWGMIDETLNPDLKDMVDSYSGGRTVLLRDDDGSLLGTGTVIQRDEGVAEILRMSVAKGRRRGGVGRQIVDELMATAEGWGMATVVLETSSSWKDVISFYVSCGFEVTHLEDGEFGIDTWFESRTTSTDQDACSTAADGAHSRQTCAPAGRP